MQGLGKPEVPKIFRNAVREARYHAGKEKSVVALRFDKETASFIIEDENGTELAHFTTEIDPDSLTVDFLLVPAGEGLDLNRIGSQRDIFIDELRFHPDRSSTPFKIRIGFENEILTQTYDPFSINILEEERR